MWVRHFPLLGKLFIWITHHDWHSCLKSMKQVESLIERLINEQNIFSARFVQTRQWSAHFWANEAPSLLSLHTWPATWSRGLCRETRALWIFTLVKTGSRIPCHPEMSSSWDLKSDMGVGHRAHVRRHFNQDKYSHCFCQFPSGKVMTKLGLALKKLLLSLFHCNFLSL